MITDTEFPEGFYKHLGYLFYAIAYADRTVTAEEYNTLQEAFVTNWPPNEKNGALQDIETGFNTLYKSETDALVAYDIFLAYKSKYESFFIPELKALILKIAGKIASVSSGKNKSELIMLAKLDMNFKKQKRNP